jgi:hypothetical protein
LGYESVLRGALANGVNVTISTRYSVGLLLCFVVIFEASCTRRTGPNVEEVKKAMALTIPIGSHVSEVTKFLDVQSFGSKRFIRGPYYDDPASISVLLKYTNDEKAKTLKATLKGYMAASIPDVSHDMFNRSGVIATFYFDQNDRLIDEAVWEELGK